MSILKNFVQYYYQLPWQLWGPIYRMVSVDFMNKYKFRAKNVGKNTYIDPSVRILGWRNVTIGDNTVISENTWLNVNHRDDKNTKIDIGNNCHIGVRNFFSSGPHIILKDYCFTGIDCQFLGCGHRIDTPSIPYLESGLTLGESIEIGVNCWLTTSVTVLQGVKIGRGSVIGGRSVVVKDIPPFSIAVGNPCRVTKRFDFKHGTWINIEDWYEELESFIPTEEDYLSDLIGKFPNGSLHLISSGATFGWL